MQTNQKLVYFLHYLLYKNLKILKFPIDDQQNPPGALSPSSSSTTCPLTLEKGIFLLFNHSFVLWVVFFRDQTGIVKLMAFFRPCSNQAQTSISPNHPSLLCNDWMLARLTGFTLCLWKETRLVYFEQVIIPQHLCLFSNIDGWILIGTGYSLVYYLDIHRIFNFLLLMRPFKVSVKITCFSDMVCFCISLLFIIDLQKH